MSAVDVVGWCAVVVGMVVGLPQLVRLIRTRRVDGLSLTAWRTMLAANLAWGAHGVRLGQVTMVLSNAIALSTTVAIVALLARRFHRPVLVLMAPSVVVAGLLTTVDHVVGSVAFGVLAILLAGVSNTGQSAQLIRAPHVAGVSTLFLTMAVLNQAMWGAWGLLVPDPGTVMTASAVFAMTSFNLTWYVLRRRGLRAFFPAPTGVAVPDPGLGNQAP
ncbi:MAG TPA: PQ-loop domain-containing transporter [Propionibacteriaceae bacterium]|nr:PQ-loop domain-containing transporter [Propionibacteriaceae bacterium]